MPRGFFFWGGNGANGAYRPYGLFGLIALFYFDTNLSKAGDVFASHEMMYANRTALALLHADRQLLRLILSEINSLYQCFTFTICQRIANSILAIGIWFYEALLHSKYHILYTNVCYRTKSNGECAVDLFFGLRQVEAHGIAPIPTFCRQWFVTVKPCASSARSEQKIED